MRLAISAGILILALGATASAYARQEKGQEDHPQGEHQQEAKPAEQKAKPAQQQHAQQAKPAQQQHAQQAKPAQQQHTQQAAHTKQPQTHAVNRAQQGNAGQSQARARQSQPAGGNRGNYAHGRISDDHYAASFGSGHRFHVSRGDYEHRRFEYGGYSFGFIDPWPVGWGYDDDVYVVYVDGGYYMYDPVHPGIRISISMF